MKKKSNGLCAIVLNFLGGIVFGISIGLVYVANEPQSINSFHAVGSPNFLRDIFQFSKPKPRTFETHKDEMKNHQAEHKNVRIVCWILIKDAKVFAINSKFVNSTWGRKCNRMVFFVSEYNSSLPAVGFDKEINEGLNKSFSMTVLGFRYVFNKYLNEADWFLGVIGSQYFIMENLRHFLSQLDSAHPGYYGHKLWSSANGGMVIASPYSGIVLSKAALKRLGNEGYKIEDCNYYPYVTGELFSRCMEQIGVTLMDTVDNKGKSRFLTSSLSKQFEPDYKIYLCNHSFWKDLEPLNCKQMQRKDAAAGKGNNSMDASNKINWADQAVSSELISFHELSPLYYPGYDYFIYSLKYSE